MFVKAVIFIKYNDVKLKCKVDKNLKNILYY